MKVIYTDQSIDSLENSLRFLNEELELPLSTIATLKDRLFNRAENLSSSPYIGQKEKSLQDRYKQR